MAAIFTYLFGNHCFMMYTITVVGQESMFLKSVVGKSFAHVPSLDSRRPFTTC